MALLHLIFALVSRLSMYNPNKILVRGRNSAYCEPLNYRPNGTFYEHWQQNSTWEILFTAVNDKSVAFATLNNEASIFWQGQEFIVKQCVSDYNGGLITKEITASHVMYECSRFRQHSIKSGTLTYAVNDVLAFIFDKNPLNFSYEVIGNFDKQQITDLGNCSGQDGLSKIIETWPDAIIYADNRHIKVYQHDAFVKNQGNRIDYLNSASEVKLTSDSTGLINQMLAIGATKDNENASSDDTNKPPEYYFPPFTVKNDEAIKKWGLAEGDDVSDDRFHDADAMRKYATSKLVLEPALTIEVTENTREKPAAGDVRRLEIRPVNLVTNVELVEFTWYPLDRDQVTQVTLNNAAQTILDYQRNAAKNLSSIVDNQKNRLLALTQGYNDLQANNQALRDHLKELQNQIDKLKPNNPVTPDKPNQPIHVGQIIDISEWQGAINWSQVVNQDLSLAIIRIQDGSAHQDIKYATNLQNAISAGARYAVYAYFRGTSNADAQTEARDFYNRTQQAVANKQQPVFYAIDVESIEMSGSASAMRGGIEAYMNQLNSLGVPDSKIVLYIANHLYDQFNLNVSRAGSIWMPSYGINDGTIAGSTRPTHTYDLWQYTSKGAIAGISGNVDMNTDASARFQNQFLK